MQHIKNLTNSPYEIVMADGKKSMLPARGVLENVEVHPMHLPLYRALRYFEITEIEGKPAPAQELDTDDLAKLRAEYQELVGKRAYHGWDAEELQKRIDAALEA
ncbi:hypothetical protein H7H48_02240 [Nitratireductor sp. B36]|uniref:hypothetical protein n=1 Tax=Nitratireductor sp. B36 TaxID=2762059 RepID=UPI001E5D32CC|nr:hypothetical protein [Nitratireductor sp. B36]MCC5777856.1 hypothetical protein [Nitratireductor sp. B36]